MLFFYDSAVKNTLRILLTLWARVSENTGQQIPRIETTGTHNPKPTRDSV